MAVTMTGVCHG